jgi:anti-sigma regulatory factor (Ser/Thr protein kinase)
MIMSVSGWARDKGFPRERISEIELAAEEALVNIVNYSYPGKPGGVEIMGKLDGNFFIIEIIDSGIPFDITSVPDPDISANADDRKVGGLGVFLMKRMVDELRYRRENDRNILELIFKKTQEG